LGLAGAPVQVTWVWKVISYPKNLGLAEELGRGTTEPYKLRFGSGARLRLLEFGSVCHTQRT